MLFFCTEQKVAKNGKATLCVDRARPARTVVLGKSPSLSVEPPHMGYGVDMHVIQLSNDPRPQTAQ